MLGVALANVTKIVFEKNAIDQIAQESGIKKMMMNLGEQVIGEAEATASDAQNGAGGTLYGYAEAGFDLQWDSRGGKRPQVVVKSNADPEMALRVGFHSQKKWGVSHLRRALYKFTKRGD